MSAALNGPKPTRHANRLRVKRTRYYYRLLSPSGGAMNVRIIGRFRSPFGTLILLREMYRRGATL